MKDAILLNAPLHCDVADAHRHHLAVIGNMDGVHLGHQELIRKTIELAHGKGLKAGAVVFEPHPRMVFQPDAAPFQLTDLETKRSLLGQLGIDTLFVLPFVEDLYRQTPEEFVKITLHQRLGLAGIATGAEFQFGAGRAGTVEVLAALAAEIGIDAHAIAPVMLDKEEKYSSSGVRSALRAGDVRAANAMLGRPWCLRGPVIEGRQLARTLDFPTANIPLGDYLRPKFGVYVITAETHEGRHPGIANIGVRPTVDGTQDLLEVHLFDFSGELYGRILDVNLHAFLRDEQKFVDLPALQAQIAKDVLKAREWHLENPA